MRLVRNLIDDLEPNKSILNELVNDGGSVSVIVRLSNHANIGSKLGFKDLHRLADLSTNLGIEIFPNFE